MPVSRDIPIIIVNQAAMARIVSRIVEDLGFQTVDAARDGTAALAMMQQKKYGLVIAEADTEPMSGLQLLRAMRSDEHLKHVPFLMTSASPDIELILSSKYAGTDSFILQPFAPKALAAKIEEAVARAGPSVRSKLEEASRPASQRFRWASRG
jgi:two-component system chemotaxis response regulator CheY